MLEALDQDADLLVHVERERPDHPRRAAGAEPASGGVDQLLRDLDVVDRVEKSEEAGVVLVDALVFAIDLSRAAPNDATRAPGGEERGVAALEERVLRRGQTLAQLEVQMGDPG